MKLTTLKKKCGVYKCQLFCAKLCKSQGTKFTRKQQKSSKATISLLLRAITFFLMISITYYSLTFQNFVQRKQNLHLLQISVQKIPLAPMGVLATGSAHARPSAQTPIDTSAHVLEGGSTNLKHFLNN